jgi:hypothetical protein
LLAIHSLSFDRKNFISLSAQKNPRIYETAYQRRAKCMPRNSKEKISGSMFGNGIIALTNEFIFSDP